MFSKPHWQNDQRNKAVTYMLYIGMIKKHEKTEPVLTLTEISNK